LDGLVIDYVCVLPGLPRMINLFLPFSLINVRTYHHMTDDIADARVDFSSTVSTADRVWKSMK
jgi:hypothetical protein